MQNVREPAMKSTFKISSVEKSSGGTATLVATPVQTDRTGFSLDTPSGELRIQNIANPEQWQEGQEFDLYLQPHQGGSNR